MERHIGTWHKESEEEKTEVGELLIDGNHIEFYSRFYGNVFPTTFIGNDGQFNYKIFVSGQTNSKQNKIIDYTASHRVFYVLKQNFGFSKNWDISGITEFSFIIPELTKWLGMHTVYYDDNILMAGEYKIPPIILKSDNPKVEIYFESCSLRNTIIIDDPTKITISKQPRIRVSYEKPFDIQAVTSEIECLMQFFGLLIGKVSIVEDIRLTIKDQDNKSLLYINRDYSYNLLTQDILNTPRTYFYILEDKLELYYFNWRDFFNNEDFSLLRRIYFSVNNNKERFAEEVFVEYMRFLDGYHTRIFGDSETEKALKVALNEAKKVIKSQIFNDENRPLFEDTIHKVLPEWRYNSNNIGDIAGWIASGYLAKKSLSHRLKELDDRYLSIISYNASIIEKLQPNYKEKIINTLKSQKNINATQAEELFDKLTETEITELLIEIYYKELGDTRNYYSHYKNDKTGLLGFNQLCDSIKVLKATIITILLSHVGLADIGRKMIAFDSELNFETMFLRKENENPFLHPKEYYEDSKLIT